MVIKRILLQNENRINLLSRFSYWIYPTWSVNIGVIRFQINIYQSNWFVSLFYLTFALSNLLTIINRNGTREKNQLPVRRQTVLLRRQSMWITRNLFFDFVNMLVTSCMKTFFRFSIPIPTRMWIGARAQSIILFFCHQNLSRQILIRIEAMSDDAVVVEQQHDIHSQQVKIKDVDNQKNAHISRPTYLYVAFFF